jgi:EAL domain-containing protein (putative c-di-GMP-specific phosphodiesterase class I)
MAGGADHLLLDTVRRRLRQPAGWIAVALHLSRLATPAPRPHHRRIARVLMEDTARRHDGEVFTPTNGDMVLLCRLGEERRAAGPLRVASPTALPDVLARLLRADLADPRELTSLWPLETAGDQALAYAVAGLTNGAAVTAGAGEPRAPADAADPFGQPADAAEMPHRRTTVLIAEDGMRPLFREVRFSRRSLEAGAARAGPADTDTDPFLLRHLAERLDRRMLDLIEHAIGGNGALDPTVAGTPRLHLNLTLPSLRSEGFARLAEALLVRGRSLGVQISLLEACADPDRFEQARGALRRLGMVVVLDGVSRHALGLARAAALEPDLVKLAWAPGMADRGPGPAPDPAPGPAADPADGLIRDLGPERVVLHGAETESALRWGLARGIRRFQGRYVETMLAALRLSACATATGCTLPQCMSRAAASAPSGRQGCRNWPLLDAAAPPPAPRTQGSQPIGSAAMRPGAPPPILSRGAAMLAHA